MYKYKYYTNISINMSFIYCLFYELNVECNAGLGENTGEGLLAFECVKEFGDDSTG